MKLNIGSGQVGGSPFEGNGWECVDDAYTPGTEEWRGPSVYHKFDITGTWPFPSEVADCIFASHILEHSFHRLRITAHRLKHFIQADCICLDFQSP